MVEWTRDSDSAEGSTMYVHQKTWWAHKAQGDIGLLRVTCVGEDLLYWRILFAVWCSIPQPWRGLSGQSHHPVSWDRQFRWLINWWNKCTAQYVYVPSEVVDHWTSSDSKVPLSWIQLWWKARTRGASYTNFWVKLAPFVDLLLCLERLRRITSIACDTCYRIIDVDHLQFNFRHVT